LSLKGCAEGDGGDSVEGKREPERGQGDANEDNGQTIDHYITYSVISAKPQLSYSSVVSTVRLFPITSGHHEGQTFVQWTGNFSSDADAGTCNLPLLSPSGISIVKVDI
jgi:hypothetical protein